MTKLGEYSASINASYFSSHEFLSRENFSTIYGLFSERLHSSSYSWMNPFQIAYCHEIMNLLQNSLTYLIRCNHK